MKCIHNWQACWECESKMTTIKPMSVAYYYAEFNNLGEDPLLTTALARYMGSISQGSYAGLSFWAAALVGQQKKAINTHIHTKEIKK
jgi:hypothetical protein